MIPFVSRTPEAYPCPTSYTIAEYIGAALVSAGLALFTLADSKMSPEFNAVGMLPSSSVLWRSGPLTAKQGWHWS
jgi:hypothetical protein